MVRLAPAWIIEAHLVDMYLFDGVDIENTLHVNKAALKRYGHWNVASSESKWVAWNVYAHEGLRPNGGWTTKRSSLKKRPSGQGLDMACGNDEMELTEGKCAQLTNFPDSTWVFARQRRLSFQNLKSRIT
jgi:hypothetical protein